MLANSSISVQMDPNAIPKSAMGSSNSEESFDRSLAAAERSHRAEQNTISKDVRERVDSRNPEVPDDVSSRATDEDRGARRDARDVA